ncbi:unnamed protein product [Acanthoscelides obtectus]|uniref:Uncharacterized protein n=1 Tax=Acanthoscelides obtectus TaxID=200917 RepID=A0A9P0NYI2_ACAOB|nr:unnamed protein product [Acanthoscelides obtectus]CAK1625201.1 hypothetical protein AOBTE_LOCUS3027 [Acanthoscelides obtectus]
MSLSIYIYFILALLFIIENRVCQNY